MYQHVHTRTHAHTHTHIHTQASTVTDTASGANLLHSLRRILSTLRPHTSLLLVEHTLILSCAPSLHLHDTLWPRCLRDGGWGTSAFAAKVGAKLLEHVRGWSEENAKKGLRQKMPGVVSDLKYRSVSIKR